MRNIIRKWSVPAQLCLSIGLLLGHSLVGEPRPEANTQSPPDVVLIFVDDLGYNDHSLNGGTDIETPNLERLADQGVIFDQGFITHPYCGPSRAGLITGRHQARFGMETNPAYSPYDYYHGLPLEETTIAERMKALGYRTGLVGKWHLGAAPEFHPMNRGFDEFFGFLSGGHEYFEVDFAEPQRKDGRLLYSVVEGTFLPLNDGLSATGFEGYLTDVLTDKAIEFINQDQDQPYFLYLAYNAPHGPMQAPSELREKYSDKGDWLRATYLAMIDSLDTNVGRILDALQQNGKMENTLVFFIGDNGGGWPTPQHPYFNWSDNSPLRAGKGSFYEGGIRVPFIASWPAQWPEGIRYEPMVSSLDVAATSIAAAGGNPNSEADLDGTNLTPYLDGEEEGVPHEYLFWRSPYNEAFAVRTNEFKLLRDAAAGSVMELYNINNDIGESHDLLAENKELAAELAEVWNAWNLENQENRSMEAFIYQKTRDDFFRQQAEKLKRDAERKKPYQINID